jgi:hypothetical protein
VQLNEVQRLDRAVMELMNNFTALTERYVTGKAIKQVYTDGEKAHRTKFDEARERADAIVYAL